MMGRDLRKQLFKHNHMYTNDLSWLPWTGYAFFYLTKIWQWAKFFTIICSPAPCTNSKSCRTEKQSSSSSSSSAFPVILCTSRGPYLCLQPAFLSGCAPVKPNLKVKVSVRCCSRQFAVTSL